MANAITAIQDGYAYQARVFWLLALKLFHPETLVERVGFEDERIKSFDDVVVEYARPIPDDIGGLTETDFVQLKFHRSSSTAITVASLTDPGFIGAQSESLLQKLQRAVTTRGGNPHCRFILRQHWGVDSGDTLAKLYDNSTGALRLNVLFAGSGARSRMGQVRKAWRDHLQVDEEELRQVLQRLRLVHDTDTLRTLRERLNEQFQLYGLKSIPASERVFPYDDFIWRLFRERPNGLMFTPEDLRDELAREGLVVSTPKSTVRNEPLGRTLPPVLVEGVAAWAERVDETHEHLDRGVAGSDRLSPLVEAVNARYLRVSLSSGVPLQERGEVEELITSLRSRSTPAARLLTGVAGLGKSGVSALVVKRAQALGWTTLAFRLDDVPPTNTTAQLGVNLGLPTSPVTVLAQLADGHESLLVIDQLDAVSQASGRQPQFFEVVRDLLEEAKRHPEMRVLLACREFDLANDDRFQQLLRGKSPQAEKLALSLLSVEQVRTTLIGAEFDPERLTAHQIEILRTPLHLTLLLEGWSSATDTQVLVFQTVNDLYRLYTQRKEVVLKQKVPTFRLAPALAPLVEHMNRGMTLSVPEALTDLLPLRNELLSEGVIRLENGRISFFHEGYFDYLYARQFITAGRGLADVLNSSEQHLFRRAQVRQVLTLLREQDRPEYLVTVRELLTDRRVRFHLKELTYGLLWQWPDPWEEEWQLIAEGLESSDPAVAEFSALSVRIPAIARFLLAQNLLAAWFDGPEGHRRDLAEGALSALLQTETEAFVEFVRPRLDGGADMPQRVSSIIGWHLKEESRSFFELLLDLYARGLMEEHRFWVMLHEVSKGHPDWAVEGIVVILRKLIGTPMPNDLDEHFGRVEHLFNDDWHANETLTRCAEAVPEQFLSAVLPEMLALATKYSYASDFGDHFQDDRIWRYRLDFGLNHSSDELLSNIIHALGKLSTEDFRHYAVTLEASPLEIAQYLLLRGYIDHAEACADEAIYSLIREPERLRISEHGSFTKLTRRLIQAVSPHASAAALRELEQILMHYTTRWEKSKEAFRSRGLSEYRLLTGIVPEVRSKAVQRRVAELTRKFPEEDPERPRLTHWSGVVQSPLPSQAMARMSDEAWISAMHKYNDDGIWSRKHTQTGEILGGAQQLAQALGAQAKSDPVRYLNLGMKMPLNVSATYFEHLVIDLRGVDADPNLILAFAQRCHSLPGDPCSRWLPDLFGERPKVDWPAAALQIVADCAQAKDPVEDTWDERDGLRDPHTQGINSTRGQAAEAIGHLLFAKPERFEFFRSVIETLVHDPVAAVRACAVLPLLAVFNQDAELAVAWFIQLAETREEVLGTHYATEFIRYASLKHFNQMMPLIERLSSSSKDGLARAGATLACLAAFDHPEAQSLANQCLTGTVPQRLGCAAVYRSNVNDSKCREACWMGLRVLFQDEDAGVREEAARFPEQLSEEDFAEHRELIRAFLASPAFKEQPLQMLRKLETSALRIPSTLLEPAEAYMLGADAPKFVGGSRDAFYVREFGRLLIRLYTQHFNRGIHDDVLPRCLNLFDQMARWRIGEYFDAMRELER